MSVTPKTLDMAAILADKTNRVVVCCGAGGVGKTTTAAAMALRAAEYGRCVCVLTIDPAKRLAQALGLNDLGNTPQRVPLAPEVTGELHAMMLDMRRTFDEMVVQYSGPGRAQAILDNQFYQTVATSLAGTQEYMAMEKLGQLLSEDRWDLVVVDTPPSRNALDFLDAPQRLGSFMDSRLWRLLRFVEDWKRLSGIWRAKLVILCQGILGDLPPAAVGTFRSYVQSLISSSFCVCLLRNFLSVGRKSHRSFPGAQGLIALFCLRLTTSASANRLEASVQEPWTS